MIKQFRSLFGFYVVVYLINILQKPFRLPLFFKTAGRFVFSCSLFRSSRHVYTCGRTGKRKRKSPVPRDKYPPCAEFRIRSGSNTIETGCRIVTITDSSCLKNWSRLEYSRNVTNNSAFVIDYFFLKQFFHRDSKKWSRFISSHLTIN